MERDSIVLRLPDPDEALAGVRLATDRGFPVAAEPFVREGDSWTLRMAAPALDRFEYALAVQRADGEHEQWTDPGNPLRAPGAFGEKSVVELPGYAAPAWLGAERVPGHLDGLTVASSALGAELEVAIWRPEDARDDEPLDLLVAHDGPELDQLARLTDYCAAHIAAGALPRHRVALVAPGDRDQWYSASALYARTLATRVLPAIADAVAVRRPVGAGVSLGGPGDAARAATLPRCLRGALPAVGQLLHAALRRPGVGLRALPADRALRARDAARAAAARRSRWP